MNVLALDIGGTKLMAALVDGHAVIETRRIQTDRDAGAAHWLSAAADLCADWTGRFDRVGIAVTGRIDAAGRWSALNRATLNIEPSTPLTAMAGDRFGVPAMAINDAQAAAWAEYRRGAGQGRDLVFLTISTGIGGGIVLGGRLRQGARGLAGHFGQIRGDGETRLESRAAGRWLLDEADAAGHPGDAVAVFDAAGRGAAWSVALRATCLDRIAGLCSDIQLMLDPDVIVIGGGIGLSDGFLPDLEARLQAEDAVLRPTLVAAQLGATAGVIGAADLAALKDLT